jgi:CBS domain-containing protein
MKLRQALEEEPVRSLTLRDAILIEPYTVVRAAIALMRTRGLGCAIIVKQGQVPTGIFTERSVLEVLAHDACLDDQPVCEFTDPAFVCVSQDDPISAVWDAVQNKGARFVCVTDKDGKVVGLSGQRGLAEYIADCFAKQITVQRLGETPWMSEREGA